MSKIDLMKSRYIAICSILAAAAALTPARADDTRWQWMLASTTAGPNGASLRITISGTDLHHEPPGQAVLFGVGKSRGGHGSIVVSWESDSLLSPVSTTRNLGGLYQEVAPANSEDGVTGTSYDAADLAPGEEAALLFFETNVSLRTFYTRLDVSAGSASPLQITSGLGTHALEVSPDDDGDAAQAQAVAAGSLTHHENPTAGIAGGIFSPSCLVPCAGTWSAPDGRNGSWANPSLGSNDPSPRGDTQFAGPGGTWTWTWKGADVDFRPHAYAAYAPIGDAWTLFN